MTANHHNLSVCVFSGNRADYGPLEPVILEALKRESFSLSLLVSKAHKPVNLDEKCQIFELDLSLEGTTTQNSIQQSALTLRQVGDYLESLQPDWIIILGDRFEALAAAQAAVLSRIPIAHLCGGDQSLGSYDEYFRHAITKLAQLHFVTHLKSAQRVIQLGEDPHMVHVVGHPGIGNAFTEHSLSKADLYRDLHLDESRATIMVCFHSVTSHSDFGESELNELCSALENITKWQSVQIIATAANPDPFGATINRRLKSLSERHDNFSFHHTLGKDRFFAMMKYCQIFMGNSSAIIYEAPVMGLHSINIGDRQNGRERPVTVRAVSADHIEITGLVTQLLKTPKPAPDFSFGDGSAAKKICDILIQQHAIKVTE